MKYLAATALAVGGLTLAACGGNSETTPPPTKTVTKVVTVKEVREVGLSHYDVYDNCIRQGEQDEFEGLSGKNYRCDQLADSVATRP